MAHGRSAPDEDEGGDVIGARLAAAGAAGLALGFAAVVLLAGLPFFRVVGVVMGLLMVLLAVGLWRRWPGAIVMGAITGGLAVGFGLPMLLGAGDDVYEQVPSVHSAVVPAIALGLGAVLLLGAMASAPVRAGAVGRAVALVLLALGLVLGGLGAWRLLERREVQVAGGVVDCGTAFRPVDSRAGLSSTCWDSVGPARGDARSMLAWAAVLVLAGLGLLPGQFGRMSWIVIAAVLGGAALAVASATASMPLQSNSCRSVNEAYTGPVCDGLRRGLRGVTIAYALAGALLVVGAVVGAVGGVVRRRPAAAPVEAG